MFDVGNFTWPYITALQSSGACISANGSGVTSLSRQPRPRHKDDQADLRRIFLSPLNLNNSTARRVRRHITRTIKRATKTTSTRHNGCPQVRPPPLHTPTQPLTRTAQQIPRVAHHRHPHHLLRAVPHHPLLARHMGRRTRFAVPRTRRKQLLPPCQYTACAGKLPGGHAWPGQCRAGQWW